MAMSRSPRRKAQKGVLLMPLMDPYTGEPVSDDNRKGMREISNRLDEEARSFYRAAQERWELRDLFLYELADTPAVLPPRTQRTAKQEQVARCPRCGSIDGERPTPIRFVLDKLASAEPDK